MTEENAELIDYLRVVWKWKWVIILLTLVSVLTAVLVSFVIPPRFKATTIIEVGRIFVGGDETAGNKIDIIENIESASAVLESDDILDRLRKKSNLNMSLSKMRDKLEVEPLLGEFATPSLRTRLIKVTFEHREPQLAVKLLDTLGELLVEQHIREYRFSVAGLDKKMQNLQEKIKICNDEIRTINEEEIKPISNEIIMLNNEIDITTSGIKRENEYKKVIHDQIEVARKALVETEREISKVKLSEVSPLEILFLQTTLRDQEERIADFYRELKEVDLAIGRKKISVQEKKRSIEEKKGSIGEKMRSIEEKKQEIRDLRAQILNLEDIRATLEPSQIRSKAIIPDEPINSRRGLNIAVAGVVGLIVALVIVFFLEYLHAVRIKERGEK